MQLDPKALIDEFLQLVEDRHLSDDEVLARLSMLCDRLALIVPQSEPALDGVDYGPIPERDYQRTRERVSERFPSLGFYNAVVDVTEKLSETEFAVGDAVDDLADIVDQLEAVSWCFEHTSATDALWQLWDSYTFHWGEHLRYLQLYLYCSRRQL